MIISGIADENKNFSDQKNDFESLIQQTALTIQNFCIPLKHIEKYKAFYSQYTNNPTAFFERVGSVETEVLKHFCKDEPCFYHEKLGESYLSFEEIQALKKGSLLKKSILNKSSIQLIRIAINNTLNANLSIAQGKYLHFLNSSILNFIYHNKQTFFQPVESLFNTNHNISFEFGYFRTSPGAHNPYWHDDYTIFKNDATLFQENQALILNCHIALSPVTAQSSPLCFMYGTQNIVYARSALKFFKENQLPFNEDLFLKAIYLGESLYKPGEKVKTNFLGLLPNYLYRLHQVQQDKVKFAVFFEKVQPGDFLIFSPNYMHTSPYKNTENTPRESIVLRCLADETYHYRNVISVENFREMVSFALGVEISINQLKKTLWKDHPCEISSSTSLHSNIYLHKDEIDHSHSFPRLYLEDLYRGYQTKFQSS